MSALLFALLLGQSTDPMAWLVVPKVSVLAPKLQSSAWKSGVLARETIQKAADDSLVITYYSSGKQQTLLTASDQSRYKADPATAQAASLAPNADMRFVVEAQRALSTIAVESNGVSWQRATQRLGFDKVKNVLGGATLVGSDTMHVDALASYPPPRSGFVEALGPAVSGEIPAWVPKDATDVACVSVRPSAVFSQANLAFAAASPMDQVLFLTHLRGLESQYGKQFAENALGPTPRLWTTYRRAGETVGILEVADVALVKRFLDSYADAITALLPGTKVERATASGHETVSVTLPSKETFAIAYGKTSVVLAQRSKALTAHFAAKGRGKASAVVANAIAYGTSTDVVAKAANVADGQAVAKDSATWSMVLTDAGLRFVGDVKARK